MRSKLVVSFGLVLVISVVSAWIYKQNQSTQQIEPIQTPSALPSPLPSSSESTGLPTPDSSPTPDPSTTATSLPSPVATLSSLANPDLTTDPTGLSKSTVLLSTSQGLIKFKFYPKEAPKTVQRIIELINKGFYNGLTFHRVIPGFVVQGGDPLGNGSGGSGQKLAAEFNFHRHIEGTVAMARGADPNSADSQFYISLGTSPHLDNKYTVFGQVIDGMDVVKKIQKNDKIMSMIIQ